jgi:Ca2+-binding EF-hand superfamily protein
MLKVTPPLSKCSDKFFRNLGQNGLISYAEYLFLITLLTKSSVAFKVAFTMFDENNNGKIDKNEFLQIRSLVLSERSPTETAPFYDLFDFEAVGLPLGVEIGESTATDNAKLEEMMSAKEQPNGEEPQQKKRERRAPDTTMVLHLFGHSGKASLTFEEFEFFYYNLQRELIEIEFHEFARGKSEVSAVDFARLVLRYSVLHKSDQSPYIRRVYERSQIDEKGITLHQFEQFSMFLNNLEDFSKAVRLYSSADIPVSQGCHNIPYICSVRLTKRNSYVP